MPNHDIVCTNAITGAWANQLRASLARAGLDPNHPKPRQGGFDLARGEEEGKAWKDLWSVGQVKAIEPVSRVVERLQAEYAQALDTELTAPWRQRHRGLAC